MLCYVYAAYRRSLLVRSMARCVSSRLVAAHVQYSQWQAVVWSFASTIVVLQSIALELLYASKKRLFCDRYERTLHRGTVGRGGQNSSSFVILVASQAQIRASFAVAARAAAACLE